MTMEGSWNSKKVSSSGIAFGSGAVLKGFLIGCDGVNDVSGITIYDGEDNTGREVIPTHGVDASTLDLKGAMNVNVDCPNGIYIEFTTSGTAEIIVYYTPK